MRRMFRSLALGTVTLAIAGVSIPATAAPACPKAGYVVVERKASSKTRPVKDGQGHPIFVRRNAITTTRDLTEIRLAGDAEETQIQMTFTPAAALKLHEATTNRSGIRIAFVSDDQALSIVMWTGPYGMDADRGVQINLGGPAPEIGPLIAAIQRCVSPGSSGRGEGAR